MVSPSAATRVVVLLTFALVTPRFVGCSHAETASNREQPRASRAPPPSVSAVAAPPPSVSAVAAPPPSVSAVAAPPPTPSGSSTVTETVGAQNQGGLRKPCLLLAVGDSITDPKSAGGGYLTQVERACACTVVNLGKGGDMVNQMKPRLLAHLRATPNRYSDVLIFGGVNDLYSDQTAHRTVAKIERDLQAMYLAARNHGARVIALTVAPWGGFHRWYNPSRAASTQALNAFIATSTERGLTDYWVDAYAELSCGDPERLCDRYASPFKDGLHFGPLGHRRLGAALVRALGKERCSLEPDAGSAPLPKRVPTTEATSPR